MDAPQFTPGPWAAERDLPHNRMPRVHGGDHSLICEVGNMGTSQDQWEANARLIAAAPEMYERLSSAANVLRIAAEFMDEGGTTDAARLEAIKADCLLAKARGEQ
jgi:hypothetical protein